MSLWWTHFIVVLLLNIFNIFSRWHVFQCYVLFNIVHFCSLSHEWSWCLWASMENWISSHMSLHCKFSMPIKEHYVKTNYLITLDHFWLLLSISKQFQSCQMSPCQWWSTHKQVWQGLLISCLLWFECEQDQSILTWPVFLLTVSTETPIAFICPHLGPVQIQSLSIVCSLIPMKCDKQPLKGNMRGTSKIVMTLGWK